MRRQNNNVDPLDRYPYITMFFIRIVGPLVILGAWSSFVLNHNRHPAPIVFDRGNVNPITVPKPKTGADYPPILAYTIFGSNGDSARMLRILKSIYHPRNQYLLYLDVLSPNSEREKLWSSVESQEEFQAFGNVHVSKSYVVTPIGDSSLPAVLHASALLLRLDAEWDWFTALSSSDYPLIPQDDILYMLSSLPRHLNFIQYTNRTDEKPRHLNFIQYTNGTVSDENDGKDGVNDIVVDTSIHMKQSNPILSAQQSTVDPDAFKIYRGSPWMILSRNLIAHCVLGSSESDNISRKLLLYFTNVHSPLEYYFHTVMCNTPKFQNSIVNTDLRYSLLETRNPKDGILEGKRPHDELVLGTPAVFARPYEEDDPLLEEIDTKILHRSLEGVAPGNWCIEPHMHETNNHPTEDHAEYFNNCSSWGSIDSVKPGKYGIFLAEMFATDVGKRLLFTDQCQGLQHSLASFT